MKIPLKSSCPTTCVCNSKQIRNWHHKQCGTLNFINDQGDISCEKNCEPYFLKDAQFQCSQAAQNNSWEQYRSFSEFLSALQQAIQACEFSLKDQDLVKFVTTLSSNIYKKWNN